MTNSSDPSIHQAAERQFIAHVERLLASDGFRLDTSGGLKSVTGFARDVNKSDGGVDLKRLMTELGKTDRDLQNKMPLGQRLEATLSTKKWWFFKSTVGRLVVITLSPVRKLLAGERGEPIGADCVKQELSKLPPSLNNVPTTVILVSTSGFTPDARELVDRRSDRTVLLAQPNDAGGWNAYGPSTLKAVVDQLDPEAGEEKKNRLEEHLRASQLEMMSGGVVADKIAAKTQLPLQWVEAELKNYAKANPGLTAKRLDGRLVLFREGAAPLKQPGGDMPFLDAVKSLFNRKGETEKKVSLLAERRATLSQQRDRAYDDLGALESNESRLKQEFATSASESAKRRLTAQLLQARKELSRKQQLMSVLNQQIDVVSTHLHTLELVQQGKTAQLPSGEDLTKDAEEAEDVLAKLQADRELASTITSPGMTSLSDEEQALYDELSAELQTPAAPAKSSSVSESAQSPPARTPEPPPRQRERETT